MFTTDTRRFTVTLIGLFTVHAQAMDYIQTVESQGPLAHYSLQDASDNQGGSDLNANGASLNDSTPPLLQPAGGFDGFDDTNTYARFSNNANHVLTDLATGWTSDAGTISYWIKLAGSGTSTQTGLFANRSGGATVFSGPDMIATFARNNGSFGINIDGKQIDAASGTMNIGDWHHLLFTWERIAGTNNDEMHVYLDGVLAVSRTNTDFDLFTVDQARFGREIGGTTRLFSGTVDELAIWDRRLSLDEIDDQFQAGFIPGFVDTDADGLDDNWERSFFTNLTFAAGTDNNDGDTLDNLGEQDRGTNPLLSDTDTDGLNDDVENGSGVYNGPGNPGSDPTVADTDLDGIDDGDEISPANGYVTNPNRNDTDGDGFTDLVEIGHGTDPTDVLDFPTALPLVINEIMAINARGLEDGFGETEDWIEIYNPNTNAINLQAYALSDNPAEPFKWVFPNLTVGAEDYVVVFASGRDTNDVTGAAHTNFKLDGNGEYLGLTRIQDNVLQDAFSPAFPRQFEDVSYGPRPTDFSLRFFATPTPGAANSQGYPGVVRDTQFNFDRGFYTNEFQVTISSATTNATIRYTLDGRWPSETQGLIYTGPIDITNTVTLRAIATFDNWLSTDVDTHTYIFIDQVAQQPAQPAGWPTDWGFDSEVGQNVTADYEMDPRVATNALPGFSVEEALLDIPTLSISMDPSDFLGPGGIYSIPRSRVEKTCSLELIHPDGTPGFQEDCEVEIHGNSSRRPFRMQKHSFRMTFKAELGAARLDYPLIPGNEVDSYNKIVLRACFTDSWGLVTWAQNRYRPNDSQYIRDVWMKESMGAMGHRTCNTTFMHLYVNGLYWGVFNPSERIDEVFAADKFGGAEEDWDIISDFTSVASGSGTAWNAMYALANGGLTSTSAYAAIQQYVDLDQFSDYMMLHFFANAEDWRDHNGYAIRNRAANEPFTFMVWDQEIVLDNYAIQYYDYSGNNRPGQVFNALRANPDYRLLFADRVYHNLFNGGPLSLVANQQRYLDIANRIDKAIVAESARWGDTQDQTPYGQTPPQPADPNDPDDLQYPAPPHDPIYFTREDSWLVERDNVITNHLPKMYPSFIAELRAENLYPAIDPPVFSQHGGSVSNAFPLAITAASGTIFYTTDGSDPRTSATAQTYNSEVVLTNRQTVVQARAESGAEWSALASASFLVGARAPLPGDLEITEIHYNPAGRDDTEFIEIQNRSDDPIELTGLVLSTGVDFTFGTSSIEPGAFVVVVEDRVAFSNLYQDVASPYFYPGIEVAGQWTGRLNNGGDTLVFNGQSNSYLGGGISDGGGTSLDSCHYHGSPGRADDCLDIYINEVFADGSLELATSGNDVSGLFLSNDRNTPLLTPIPVTPVAPYLVFTNPVFTTEALVSAWDGTNITHIYDYQAFESTPPLGRFVRNDGEVVFVPLAATTPGATNAPPAIGELEIEANVGPGYTVQWPALPSERYRVEYRDSFQSGAWTLLTERVATQSLETVTDSSTETKRYYRVLWLP